ncbi:aldo/keto reductase [Sphingobium sp.]|uniref:aldo/keto reductase n=1 Tax=Sphingobium sp. TaxID=1912891 RepID=UPI0028BDDBF6|nr:aldo/keto reductase [Sphingobium sp.]
MLQTQIPFHDGHSIPQLGFGSPTPPAEGAAAIVRLAVDVGYRHFDTAFAYRNENEVAEGVRTASVPREEIFLTSKLACEQQGYDSTLTTFDNSMKGMGLDYIDLYLIHWPNPDMDRYVDTWRAMIRLRDEGRIRSIGVSNFAPEHLDRLKEETGEMPVINQIELNPRFQQKDMRRANADRGVVTEAWGPLTHGLNLADPVLDAIGAKYGRSPVQVALRWHIQNGVVVIPRSDRIEWMRENLDIFDFTLDAGDMAAIETLDDPDGRGGPLPHHSIAERARFLEATIAKLKAAGQLV